VNIAVKNVNAPRKPGELDKKAARPSGMTKKQEEVYKARMLGFTFEDIALSLGYASSSGAYNVFKRAVENMMTETRKEHQRLIYRTYQFYKNKYSNRAMAGELPALNAILRILEDEVKLMGSAAPARLHVDNKKEERYIIDFDYHRIMQKRLKKKTSMKNQ
jgi:hypothetical protein